MFAPMVGKGHPALVQVQPMRPRHVACVVAGTAWVAGVAFGLTRLWDYEAAPGSPAQPPLVWSAGSSLTKNDGLPTLVMLLHPRCPCSRASIGELARLMADCQGRLSAQVLVIRPQGVADAWEQTDLWRSAAEIPGVAVTVDDDGRISQEWGAATSGQCVLYSAEGQLLFAGGITASRGHSGDNAGRSIITSLVLTPPPSLEVETAVSHTPVYGCPLFDPSGVGSAEGVHACRG